MKTDSSKKSYSYKEAGVDIVAGNSLVEAIKPLAAATRRPGADTDLGGFGAIFDPKAAGFKDPLLVSATDGVGTKLKIAIDMNRHDTVGIDLVAMCVNDLVVQGAEPLFFLDYFATGGLDVAAARDIVAGIAEGCKQAGCALIGGETAEMPGMYAKGDYDLAGFTVGAVERDQLLKADSLKAGNVLLGLTSSGLHSNGFSLVRRLVADFNLDYADPAPFDSSRSLGDALIAPTRIYVKAALRRSAPGISSPSPILPGVACSKTSRGFCRRISRQKSMPGPGRYRRFSDGWRRRAISRRANWRRPLTAASAWSSWSM